MITSKKLKLVLFITIFAIFKNSPAEMSYEFIHKNKDSAFDAYGTGYLDSSRRTIELKINGKNAGYVDYIVTFDEKHSSQINTLFVNREFRGKFGCGKTLLTHAINDILNSGFTNIELSRSPFDLSPAENAQERDKQLEAWYGQFGFTNKNTQKSYHSNQMVLSDFNKFYKANIYSIFTPNEVLFKRRDLTSLF